MKSLLTSQELVTHMQQKGIKFEIIKPEEAVKFLEDRNYYFKLASYRFNYQKNTSGKNIGKYINLDFAYLKELSTIDKQLRYTILQMCLDIEHYLKVMFLNSIEHNPREDGYQIIQKYLAKDSNFQTLKRIQQQKTSEYCRNLYEKYYPYFPVWVFVEIISFGEFTHLLSFYEDLCQVSLCPRSLLNSVRDIRNASAHNNCLINHLSAGGYSPDPNVVRMVNTLAFASRQAVTKKMKNKIINDFACLLLTYDLIVSSPTTKQQRYDELQELFNIKLVRGKNREWFRHNNLITSSYSFAKKMLDSISQK